MKVRGGWRLSRRGVVAAAVVTGVVAGTLVAVGSMQASAAGVDATSWYVLVNRSSGKVLDDRGFATADGSAVVQWSRHGGTNQQWRFIDAGGGYYRLQNRNSGKVLDDYGWSRTAGAALVQWTDRNGANQQFAVAPSSDGYVRLVNRFTGMSVDVLGASGADGAVVGQYPDHGGTNQQWSLQPVGGVTPSPVASGSATPTSSSTGVPTATATATRAPSSSPSAPTSAPATSTGAPSPSATPGTGTAVRFMGSSTVLVGGSMSAASASAAPFDMQYAYLVSKPAPSAAAYTAARCDAAWSGWWGCWTGPTTSPGTYVAVRQDQAARTTYQGKAHPQRMMWSWYTLLQVAGMAGLSEGPGEAAVINRQDLLAQYLADYRFFLEKVGTSPDLIDIEPDFWGFARTLGNLHQVPAKVTAANPTDCGAQENSAAGLARCMVAMVHKYAPNAGAGLHLSCFDWQSNLKKCRSDYLDLGAQNADFLVSDVSDRDAGWYALPAHGGRNTFWNDQAAASAMAFYKTMSETVGRPLVLWQIPVGNMAQNNTLNHYQDDKVDWLFSHMSQVADAHIAALLFGAGQQEQTSPETDGGNLIARTIAYRSSGGVPLR